MAWQFTAAACSIHPTLKGRLALAPAVVMANADIRKCRVRFSQHGCQLPRFGHERALGATLRRRTQSSIPMLVTGPPAMAPAAPDDGAWLVDVLMAVDRLVVATGLLVLIGGAGFVAVARLPQAASRMTRRLERRAWWLLQVAWWATLLGTLAGLLLHGPFTVGVPLSRSLDTRLLDQTLHTRFGAVWALRTPLLLILALLRVWSLEQATRMRTSIWLAIVVAAAVLAVTPALSGHAGAGPDAVVGIVVGVLHFSAVAVWFGGLILLGTCVLPRPDVGLLQAVPRFSSVAFGAMVVIVVTGIAQSWRQLGSLQALGHTAYGRLLVGKVAAFLLLIGFAGYSRVLVRRKLTARAVIGAAAPQQPPGGTGPARLSDHAGARPIWLLRRLVLAELAIALLVLAITALLGITTPPGATWAADQSSARARPAVLQVERLLLLPRRIPGP